MGTVALREWVGGSLGNFSDCICFLGEMRPGLPLTTGIGEMLSFQERGKMK